MIHQDNDTLNKGQKNKNQSQTDKSNNNDAMTAKLLASVAAGLAVGAGATYAAQYLNEDSDVTAEESQAPKETSAPANHNVEEHVERHDQKEHTQHKPEIGNNPQKPPTPGPTPPGPGPEPKPEDVFKGREVKIEKIEEHTLESGVTVQVYTGTVDGHRARFLAHSDGQVVAAAIDENDNGNVDENEVIDLSESNVTTQYLAQHVVDTPPAPEHKITVVAVENDVEFRGETVDLAIVAMDDQPVMLVDRNQNGEVDLTIADYNHNGSIDEGEEQDVSDAHVTMPTVDDISGDAITASTDNGMEDYSNNADVTVYDV